MLLGGCATTKVVSSWSAGGDQTQTTKSIFVVSLMGGKYTGIQQMFEDDVVATLQNNGVNATSSIAKYGPAAFNGMKQEDILAKISSTGSTSVPIVSLLDKKKDLV